MLLPARASVNSLPKSQKAIEKQYEIQKEVEKEPLQVMAGPGLWSAKWGTRLSLEVQRTAKIWGLFLGKTYGSFL